MVTRPCLSGVSGWALARKTRTKSRTTREEPGAACISAGDPVELGRGEDVEAAFLAGRDDQPAGQRGAEARREEQPALVVEPGRERAQELVHGRHLLDPSHPPGCTGFLHFTPPLLHNMPKLTTIGSDSQHFRRSAGVVRSGGATRRRPVTGSPPDAAPAPRRPSGSAVARGGRRPPSSGGWSAVGRVGAARWSAVERARRVRRTRRGARRPNVTTRHPTSRASPNPVSVRQDRGHPAP